MARPGPRKQFPHQISLSLDDDSHEFLTRMAEFFGVKPQDVARGAIQKSIEHFDQATKLAFEEFAARDAAQREG
ncbi:hypothetical protein AB0H57_05520 [Micromonospora sp. NPDC050686]|uniref:hypothetical protein n=1 Tax=Micromonospora sp. NPDC050686 TaxID=3154631 RepID=UPI0033CF1CAB